MAYFSSGDQFLSDQKKLFMSLFEISISKNLLQLKTNKMFPSVKFEVDAAFWSNLIIKVAVPLQLQKRIFSIKNRNISKVMVKTEMDRFYEKIELINDINLLIRIGSFFIYN